MNRGQAVKMVTTCYWSSLVYHKLIRVSSLTNVCGRVFSERKIILLKKCTCFFLFFYFFEVAGKSLFYFINQINIVGNLNARKEIKAQEKVKHD
jgi:hypothetical protein